MSESGQKNVNNYKRRINYYRQPAKRNRNVDVGLKGFLCSCNFKENECVKESYNILNEYNDKLLENEENASAENENTNLEIEEELSVELANLKKEETKYKFQVLDSGAKNLLFIKTSVEDPVKLAHKIMEDINERKQQKTRYLIRLIPVQTVSKANIVDIVKALLPFLEVHFKSTPTSYSINYNHRNNDSVSRNKLISEIASNVQTFNSENKVDLTKPDISIVVEVIRKFAYLAVIPDFIKYKKFNLISISQENPKENHGNDEKQTSTEIEADSGQINQEDTEEKNAEMEEKTVQIEENRAEIQDEKAEIEDKETVN